MQRARWSARCARRRRLRRAILLPTKTDRSFVYDLAYIAANKNFTEGGIFDRVARTAIIETKRLPKGFVINDDDIVVFNDDYYTIASLDQTEKNSGYVLGLKNLPRSDKYGTKLTVSGTLTPIITGNYVLNGRSNGETSYSLLGGSYWIWYDGAAWNISAGI